MAENRSSTDDPHLKASEPAGTDQDLSAGSASQVAEGGPGRGGSGALLEARFRALADEWRRETGMLSSISKKVQHPAYRQIIALGRPAVPLILHELRDRPAHWFAALQAITGETPVAAPEAADPRKVRQAWLDWGKARGLID
jgi:hypothetical protein